MDMVESEGGVSPPQLIVELRKILPRDAIVTIEVGSIDGA